MGTDTERSNSNIEYNMASIMVNKKSEALALILSLLIPGLGQIYNGQVSKGAMMIVAAIVCAVLIFVFFPIGILYIVLWIYAMYDAFKDAKEYNQYLLSALDLRNVRCVQGRQGVQPVPSQSQRQPALVRVPESKLLIFSIRLTRTVHPGSTAGAMQSAPALSLACGT